MITRSLAIALALVASGPAAVAHAQATPLAAVQELFDAMRAADRARVAQVFHPEARFLSIAGDSTGTRVTTIAPEAFARTVGSWAPGFADERFGRAAVHRDGPLAEIWMRYHFYADGAFHHCGAETFTMVESTPGRWQILGGTDTRQTTGCAPLGDSTDLAALDTVMNRWHRAAATADEDVFFGTMSPDGVYLGTDATERWLRDSMAVWAAPYFQRETAWAFTPRERHWQLSDDGATAWFDEHLDSWMGVVRGSGVLTKVFEAGPQGAPAGETRWVLRHYNLALAVPNESMEAVRKAIDPAAKPH